jgi:hypothetical protein
MLHDDPRELQARLAEARAAKYAARWDRDFRRVKAERDAAARHYSELYPKVVAQLVELFRLASAVDAEAERADASAPPGFAQEPHPAQKLQRLHKNAVRP